MTLAWAIIIVAVLFLLDKYHLLKRSLIAAGIVVLALVVIVMGYFGWQYLDTRWDEHENKVRLAKQNALFAQKNECLNLYTGKVHPVNQPGSQTEEQSAALGPNNAPSKNVPSDLQVGKPVPPGYTSGEVPIPQGAIIGGDGLTSIRPGGLMASDEHWCNSNEVVHERGTPIDPWLLRSEWPTIPPGQYYVSGGTQDSDGGWTTAARLCVETSGEPRCYLSQAKGNNYGNDAKAEEIRVSDGGKLLLFTADNWSGGNTASTTVALLANRGGQLGDLLPEISNADEYRFWNLPDISPMPVFATAEFIWEMSTECHACPHRYRIITYLYDKRNEVYVKYDEFVTDKHEGSDNVLALEKAVIVTNLKKAIAAEATRHIVVK